ncbi:MAG: precorrin-3B C(17)-methyltransferase [Rhodospirillaceae bacterium]|nr:precorrin-3B C(17)-methyltransferase [Rhodospirillaceae bacterium]
MTGFLAIVGLGPGAADLVTPRATAALETATDLVGYGPYLNRVPLRDGQRRHPSDNREELARAGFALDLAAEGRRVAIVSAGDAGVFGMAAALFEALETAGGRDDVVVEVIPGISAVLAAAARIGAPCGNDFCVISLSDNLKPWETVLARVAAAAEAGFVLALYNAVSKARPWQLDAVLERLRERLAGDIPVVFATAVSRPEERIQYTTLAEARSVGADMRTLVLIGTAETRCVAGSGRTRWVYTPRRVGCGAAAVGAA